MKADEQEIGARPPLSHTAKALLGVLVLVLTLSLYGVWAGLGLVGKTFSGFSMEFSFITFPVDSQDWTGSKADFQYFEQIQAVDGQRFAHTGDFTRYIQSLAPGTPVEYSLLREGKTVKVKVPTMVFSWIDYAKTFGINLLLTLLYAGLSLFILLRRGSLQHSRALLFLTFGSAAAYALRAPYDYLHLFLPAALLSFCAFPLSLFLLGTHLAKAGTTRATRLLRGLESFHLCLSAALGLSLAGLSLILAEAPHAQPAALGLFVGLYQFLIASYLVDLICFVGFLLWRSLRRASDELKTWQARIILVGSIFSFVPNFVILAAFWVFKMPWTLPSELIAANTSLFSLFVFYAVLHDEGVALEGFVRKTAFYYSLAFVFGLAYTVLYRFATIFLATRLVSTGQDATPWLAMAAAFGIVWAFNGRLELLVSSLFYRQRKELVRQLEQFMQDSTSTLEPEKIVTFGLDFLRKGFAPRSLALYLAPFHQGQGPASLIRYRVPDEPETGLYPERLSLSEAALTTQAQIQQFKRRHELDQEVVLPLYKNENLLGLFILDKKGSGLSYFAEDHQLLQQFAFYFTTGFYISCLSQSTLAAHEKSEAAKRMEVLGTLASGVAHDFNNLLSTIVMSVGLMKYISQDAQILERLQVIQQSAEKGAAITRALSDYATTLPPDEALSIKAVLQDLEARLAEMLPSGIAVRIIRPDQDYVVLADMEQLQRALSELARNAWIAMGGQGLLTIEARMTGPIPPQGAPFEAEEQEFLSITLSDTGEGIPESILARIFDPFFSAWNEGRGIGLGLSIARQIVKNHNGQLEVSSREGQGSSFSIYLPLASQVRSRIMTELSARPEADPDQPGMILLIDDEAELRALLREALEREGYAVLEAGDGEAGLDLYRRHLEAISLVVCDLEMPRFNGREFISAAHTADPDIPILVSSGNVSPADEKAFLQQGVRVLHKPYSAEQLLTAIRQLHRV